MEHITDDSEYRLLVQSTLKYREDLAPLIHSLPANTLKAFYDKLDCIRNLIQSGIMPSVIIYQRLPKGFGGSNVNRKLIIACHLNNLTYIDKIELGEVIKKQDKRSSK